MKLLNKEHLISKMNKYIFEFIFVFVVYTTYLISNYTGFDFKILIPYILFITINYIIFLIIKVK